MNMNVSISIDTERELEVTIVCVNLVVVSRVQSCGSDITTFDFPHDRE